MTDLTGIAHQLHRSVENLRIAAGLLEQGYQPAFIAQYRADESGNLSRAELWALKLEIDRQQRLATARVRLTSQLPKDAVLDEEAEAAVAASKTELDIEVALRAFRARRSLGLSGEGNEQASSLLEQLIAAEGLVEDVEQYAAEKLGISKEAAPEALEQTRRLIGSLLAGDTDLARKLRESIQKKAKVSVELCPQPTSDTPEPPTASTDSAAGTAAPSTDEAAATPADAGQKAPAEAASDSTAEVDDTSAQSPSTETAANESTDASGETTSEAVQSADSSNESGEAQAAQPDDADAEQPATQAESSTTEQPAAPTESASAAEGPGEEAAVAADAEQASADTGEKSGSDGETTEDADAILSKRFGDSKKSKKKAKAAAAESAKAKSAAKLTPRQRRRRWLVAMLTPMKNLKKPLGKLTSYQQLMLGRGRRSQIVETHLDYDKKSLIPLSRDRFVRRDHPLAKWFSAAAEAAFDAGLRGKLESDAVAELEELASEQLLTTAAEGLRRTLMQRPVRGHRIMVVDSVGPKVSAVAIVDQAGNVLACDEIQCSALATMVEQNVMRLGELAHKYKVTLLALTNGPARRFLVHTMRELMKQSASSGLRWTMADRSGADAYAAGRIALRELSAFNRRDRAAIWVARSLQDPLTQYLKVGINRIRLGSYQRELPQEPLKKLVRETIADCVASRGVDVHSASVAQLLCVPGVTDEQAQQIATLAAQGNIESRAQLLEAVDGWTETQSRQAIGLLRVFGSEQTFDATGIHPDDYRLAQRLVDNTELESPPAAPEGWTKPDPMDVSETNSDFVIEEAQSTTEASSDGSTEDSTATETTESTTVEVADCSDDQAASAEASPSPAEDATASSEVSESTEATSEEPTSSDTNNESTGEAASDTPTETEPEAPEEAVSEGTGDSSSEEAAPADAAQAEDKQATSEASSPAPEYPEDVEAAKAKPLPIDVEKLARGWQVGREKLKSIAYALNEPFADTRLRGAPVPLRTEMPTLENLKPGTCIWAVVVGVADFGIFVELGPECSGLIHISRLSDRFVDDPHEFVQVGDLIMTWVVNVDEKKGRVALTALSPQQRDSQRSASDGRDGHRGRGDGRGSRGGQRDGAGQRGRGGESRGGDSRGGPGGQRGSGQRDGGQRGGNRDGQRGGGQRGGGQRGPGRGRDNRGGNRSRDNRPSKPVIVKSKKPVDPISSAMKEGAEPLRSFSDLLQFYDAKRTDEPETKAAKSETKVVGDEANKETPAPSPEAESTPTTEVESQPSEQQTPPPAAETAKNEPASADSEASSTPDDNADKEN